MDFVVVDVETANCSLSSICQVGAAFFSEGKLCRTWQSLVNPKEHFDRINVWIHGIDEEKVKYSPTWSDIYETLRILIDGEIVVSHTAFDRVAFLRACEKNGLASCQVRWLDSARVVRRAWSEFSKTGYGLANIAAHFHIPYKAHDALEDARCAGEILIRAIAKTGLSPEDWIERVKLPIHGGSNSVAREGDPDGPLHGETLVFTGALSMTRHEAANAAASAGCKVTDGVTKNTTLLVVGNQDVRKLAGKQKSSKYCKAENLISNGQQIRILQENDFMRMLKMKENLGQQT